MEFVGADFVTAAFTGFGFGTALTGALKCSFASAETCPPDVTPSAAAPRASPCSISPTALNFHTGSTLDFGGINSSLGRFHIGFNCVAPVVAVNALLGQVPPEETGRFPQFPIPHQLAVDARVDFLFGFLVPQLIFGQDIFRSVPEGRVSSTSRTFPWEHIRRDRAARVRACAWSSIR